MEQKIKMQKKNEDGIMIIKEIPEDLSAFYMNMGWKIVSDKAEIIEDREEKKSSLASKK